MVEPMRARTLILLFSIVGIFALAIPVHAAIVDSQPDDSAQAIRPSASYYWVTNTRIQVPNYLITGYVPSHTISISGVRFRINGSDSGNYVCPKNPAVMTYYGTSTPALWDSGLLTGLLVNVATTTPDANGDCDYTTRDQYERDASLTFTPNNYYIFFIGTNTEVWGNLNWVSMSGKPITSTTSQSFFGYRPATDNRYIWGTMGLSAPYFEMFDTEPPPLTPPDPCATPGACVSNVLFLPGIEGSRLYYRGALGIEHQVWEPDFHTDIPYLAMNADGTSKYQLYTKDVVGKIQEHNPLWSTIANIFRNNLEVYSSFESSMNNLVASSTFGLKKWEAYPYDWRYDVRDIVQNGTPTEMSDGSIRQVYLRNVLEEMASSSPTGKVTIVAHSNGGLLAKALAISLGVDAPKYIDRIIMVGTPQWGTPSDIGAMLHGDDGTNALGIISNSGDIRAAAETMPAVYGLLPSPAYFAHISDPVVTFNTGGLLSGKFSASFGSALSSFTALKNFITDAAGLDAQAGSATDLRSPLALSGSLVDKATATHAVLDAWTPPAGITTTAIAGWGQDTVEALAYTTGSKVVCTSGRAFTATSICADTPSLQHTPVLTQDGDNTVVSPSAVGDTSNWLYFDASAYKSDGHGNFVHQNLTSAVPIEDTITHLLMGADIGNEQYMVTTKPPNGTNPIKLRVSSHSPVNLVVTDASGNQSGVLPIPGTDFSGMKRDIPGSSVQVLDDEQYVNVPESGTYKIVASGYAAGSAMLDVDTIGSDGTVTATTTFANIPTTASSTITLSVVSGTPTAPSVDLNGDGTADFTAVSSSAGTDPLVYARYIRTVIASLSLSRSEKNALDGWLRGIEQQLTSTQKEPHSKWQNDKVHQYVLNMQKSMVKTRLDMLKRYIEQQVALAALPQPQRFSSQIGISATEAEIIIGMINQLKTLL